MILSSSDQDLINSLLQYRQSVKTQLDAVTQSLLSASGADVVRLEAERDTFGTKLREIEQEIQRIKDNSLHQAHQELIQILDVHYTACTEGFSQAYERSRHSLRHIPPLFTNAEELVRDLLSWPTEPDKPSPLHTFVLYALAFSNEASFPTQLVQQLKQWTSRHIPKANTLYKDVKDTLHQVREQQQKNDPCLMVRIRYSNKASTIEGKGDRYYIQAWFIEDIPTYRANPNQPIPQVTLFQPKPDGAEGETEPVSPDQTYAESDIPSILRQLRKRCIRQFRVERPLIQIFLPLELMHLDIDQWPIEEESPRKKRKKRKPCFGSRYPIVLRSLERLDPLEYELPQALKTKWAKVNRKLSECAGDLFEHSNAEDIYSLGEKAHVLGIRLNQALSHLPEMEMEQEELFETLLLDTDLPLALWLRHAEETVDIRHELTQLLDNCCGKTFLERVKEKRAEALGRSPNHPPHICRHLTILWDDPTVCPPVPFDVA